MPAGPQGDNISTLDDLFLAMNEKTKKSREARTFISMDQIIWNWKLNKSLKNQ